MAWAIPKDLAAQLQPASNRDCILLLAKSKDKGKKHENINQNNSYVFLSYTYPERVWREFWV